MYATLVQLVVIPWRGFRCFTLGSRQCSTRHANARVVIPWRGFRCFTQNSCLLERKEQYAVPGCNPLAGI